MLTPSFAVALLLTSCSSGDASSRTPADDTGSGPVPAARLSGTYQVTKTLVKGTGYGDTLGTTAQRVWTFAPECEQSDCDGTLRAYNPEQSRTVILKYAATRSGYATLFSEDSECSTGASAHYDETVSVTLGDLNSDSIAETFTMVDVRKITPGNNRSDCPVGELTYTGTGVLTDGVEGA